MGGKKTRLIMIHKGDEQELVQILEFVASESTKVGPPRTAKAILRDLKEKAGKERDFPLQMSVSSEGIKLMTSLQSVLSDRELFREVK